MTTFPGFPRPCRRPTSRWTTDRTGVAVAGLPCPGWTPVPRSGAGCTTCDRRLSGPEVRFAPGGARSHPRPVRGDLLDDGQSGQRNPGDEPGLAAGVRGPGGQGCIEFHFGGWPLPASPPSLPSEPTGHPCSTQPQGLIQHPSPSLPVGHGDVLPHDVTADMGSTGVTGTVILVHHDVWHRALRNHSGRNRYMLKFLFCPCGRTCCTRLGPSGHGRGRQSPCGDEKQFKDSEKTWRSSCIDCHNATACFVPNGRGPNSEPALHRADLPAPRDFAFALWVTVSV